VTAKEFKELQEKAVLPQSLPQLLAKNDRVRELHNAVHTPKKMRQNALIFSGCSKQLSLYGSAEKSRYPMGSPGRSSANGSTAAYRRSLQNLSKEKRPSFLPPAARSA